MKYNGYLRKDHCEHCGSINTPENKLEIHHKDESRRYGHKLMNNSPDNLLTLCRKCHLDEHLRLEGVPWGKEGMDKIDNDIREWLHKLSKSEGVSVSVIRRRILLLVKEKNLYEKTV